MMISAHNVSKSFSVQKGRKQKQHVICNLSFEMPENGHLAILGGKGSGKSTLLKMIGGLDFPDEGKIRRNGTVSWIAGGMKFERGMTVTQNLRFLGRVLGQKNFSEVEDIVAEVTGLGRKMKEEFSNLGDKEKRFLNYAALLAFDFDIALFDGIKFGQPALNEMITPMIDEKFKQSLAVVALDKAADVDDRFTHILVLADQTGRLYENRQEALEAFNKSQEDASSDRPNAG